MRHLLLATLFGFLTACASDEAPKPASHSATTLRLNDGAKWKVNEPTHVCMGRMQKLLAEFDKSDPKDHAAFGAALRKETTTIIQKCDMTGTAHRQYHIVLDPLLVAIKTLEGGAGGATEIETVRKQLKDYAAHFEH